MHRSYRYAKGSAALLLVSVPFAVLLGQEPSKLKLDTGKEIFEAGCISCHGPDGKGQAPSLQGFERPWTFPDFTDCGGTTPEPDMQWRAVITNGGPGRALSQIMPSFKDQLTADQINKVIGYLRTLCADDAKWPRGDLNFPRALIAEKAFPEDETVITATVNAHGAPGVQSGVVYEKRVGARGQIEATVPYNFTHDSGAWQSGLGDITLGYKQNLFSSNKTGSIFSVLGEVTAPTGDTTKGTGEGSTVFEPSAAFGQMLPAKAFFQVHTGFTLPAHTDVLPRAYYLRTAIGKTFAPDHGLGRWWSPMAEFVYNRDLVNGAKNNWAVVPEMQIPLAKRLHILGGIGLYIPVNNTADRPKQLMFYLLWDYVDGHLNEGWK